MSAGGATWDTATPILPGETSDPTPISGLPVGDARPYFSAWWKITPTEETNVFASAEGTTSTNGPDGYADTILIVYREDQIIGAGGDPDMAGSTYYDNDGGFNGRSKIETTLYPDTTYYIRVGASDSSGAGVESLVLSLPRWYWTEWIQRPDQVASNSAFWTEAPMTQTLMGNATRTSTPTPSADSVQAAAAAAYGATTTKTISPSGIARMSTGPIDVGVITNSDRTSWAYTATGSTGTRETRATIQMPVAEDLPPDRTDWPSGAFDAEQHPDDVTQVLAHRVAYVFTEASYDESATAGSAQEDARGQWSYSLGAGSDSVTIGGPLARGATSEGEVAVTPYRETVWGMYDVVDVSTTLIFTTAQVNDPAFGSGGTGNPGGVYRIGGSDWNLTGRTTYRPRRIRYKTTTPPGNYTTVTWWDGDSREPCNVIGWWDGSTLQPVTLLGWWDGTSIQPVIAGAT